MAALQLALSLSCSYNRSTRGMVSAIKKIDKFFFLAFELTAIPLSFNNSFKTASVIFSAGPPGFVQEFQS